MCRVNADESVAKTLKCIQLILGLNAQDKIIFMHWQSWWQCIKFVLVKN